MSDSLWPHGTAARQASLFIINFWSFLKLIHWVSDANQPSHPLLPFSLPALNLSQHHLLLAFVYLLLSFTISWNLLISCPLSWSCHLILCRPLLLLPSVFPRSRVFSSELALHVRWTEYWRFSFSISPSNECSGLISFRMDWWHLLAVQGTLKSLQCHSLKTPVVQSSVFFMVQLS